MKRYILLPILLLAPCSMLLLQAQDTYTNERLINSSSDVIGTARYVGMGGALGALGADISVISWNPAGIGLYRKKDIAVTFGGNWGKSRLDTEKRGTGTFDQIGFVYNMKIDEGACPYINFSFNYQKKINFNHNFQAVNNNLGGLSQMDQLAELTYWDDDWQNNLAGLALTYDSEQIKQGKDRIFFKEDSQGELYNDYSSGSNSYQHHSEGALHSFDFNVSTNINNRAFLGLTLGVESMRYLGWSYYRENFLGSSDPNYDLSTDFRILGTGFNAKLGTIIRPFESNPFRFAFVVETPTWYKLRNSTSFDFSNGLENAMKSKLRFNLRSPWKLRAGIGSTIGSTLAWDVDYEYAAYQATSMGFPRNEYADGSTSGNVQDKAMNQQTHDNLRGTHTLRVGLEANATKNLSFRLGYNLSTSAYNKNISFDQFEINYEDIKNHGFKETAIDYSTNTSYMRMGNTNILTVGVGYHYKKFYIDLAYKIRHQKADFYAFDTNFANSEDGDPVFKRNAPADFLDKTIDPVEVDLTRQAVTCTLGFKF